MLDIPPYLAKPMSTLAAVASDPLKSRMRFREQYAANREAIRPQIYTKLRKIGSVVFSAFSTSYR